MIIAISGRKQHGKDTVANLIQELTTERSFLVVNSKGEEINSWKKVPFAKKLKETASMLLAVPIEVWEDEAFKESVMPEEWWTNHLKWSTYRRGKIFKPTYRLFLQLLGTDVCRKIHPNFWSNATMRDYKERYIGSLLHAQQMVDNSYWALPNWLMPDCRFRNEVLAVQSRNGLVIRVVDPRKPIPNNEHESEYALDDYPFEWVLVNDGTIPELKTKLLNLLQSWQKKSSSL